ncbi:MAG: monofunctional biosynthetic peptidoglycan transglycosylase [Chthoniobacterales bacterium]
MRFVLAATLLALLLPVLQVGCVRYLNPPITPEMVRFTLTADEGARKQGLRYEWIPLSEIPRDQVRFVWASEDQRFFEHNGIDFKEIGLALEEAEESGEAPRGASTISMQCARSVFLWQGRSWIRKGLEAYYTVLMEFLLPKRRILELYLNVIEFGEGVYGVRAAAETFYDREPDELSREQMAMLVAVMPNPKAWSVTDPSARVRKRQERVLRLAKDANFPKEY